jgi:hypothetical protein
MKTLLDLIAEQARKSVLEGYRADDLIAMSGAVGAVQEWLGQDEMRDVIYGATWPALDTLRREAGKGLGE